MPVYYQGSLHLVACHNCCKISVATNPVSPHSTKDKYSSTFIPIRCLPPPFSQFGCANAVAHCSRLSATAFAILNAISAPGISILALIAPTSKMRSRVITFSTCFLRVIPPVVIIPVKPSNSATAVLPFVSHLYSKAYTGRKYNPIFFISTLSANISSA